MRKKLYLIIISVFCLTQLAMADFELQYPVNQSVYGNNTIHVRDMFALTQNYYGKAINYVMLRARSQCRDSWRGAQATLKVNNWSVRYTQSISPYADNYYFYLNNNERIGYEIQDIQLDLDCDMYIDEVRIGLKDEGYYPQPNPPTPQPTGNYYFEGRFESTPVRFSGYSHNDLFQNCRNSLARMNVSSADDIYMYGNHYHNEHSYWYADTLCAIAALNARTASYEKYLALDATVENYPIHLEIERSENPADILSQLLWYTVPEGTVDEMWVWGNYYHNSNSYWSYSAVLEILRNNIRN